MIAIAQLAQMDVDLWHTGRVRRELGAHSGQQRHLLGIKVPLDCLRQFGFDIAFMRQAQHFHCRATGIALRQLLHGGMVEVAISLSGEALCNLLLDQIWLLTGRINELTIQVRKAVQDNKIAQRLSTIPGVGPITVMTLATLAPPTEMFRRGRDFAAWAGLTPRQHSTGGKTRLGRTLKMGQKDIRRLLIIGAMSVIQAVGRRGGAIAGSWLARMLSRKPKMLVAVVSGGAKARINGAEDWYRRKRQMRPLSV